MLIQISWTQRGGRVVGWEKRNKEIGKREWKLGRIKRTEGEEERCDGDSQSGKE